MAGTRIGGRRFSIARAPTPISSSRPRAIQPSFPPPHASSSSQLHQRHQNSQRRTRKPFRIFNSSPPILSFCLESGVCELAPPRHHSFTTGPSDRTDTGTEEKKRRVFAVRKRGPIRISSLYAIPPGNLSAYHDVRRGLVIPVGGHHQCRQPVPTGLLHYHVQ